MSNPGKYGEGSHFSANMPTVLSLEKYVIGPTP